MALARYQIVVPRVDSLGNPLKDIAALAHHHLSYNSPVHTRHVFIDGGKRGQFDHDLLVAHADELPEHDSHMKQLAGWVGDLANHPMIHVSKQGKSGMQGWDIANRLFRPGQPAEDLVRELPMAGGAMMYDQALAGPEGHPQVGVVPQDGAIGSLPAKGGNPLPSTPAGY